MLNLIRKVKYITIQSKRTLESTSNMLPRYLSALCRVIDTQAILVSIVEDLNYCTSDTYSNKLRMGSQWCECDFTPVASGAYKGGGHWAVPSPPLLLLIATGSLVKGSLSGGGSRRSIAPHRFGKINIRHCFAPGQLYTLGQVPRVAYVQTEVQNSVGHQCAASVCAVNCKFSHTYN